MVKNYLSYLRFHLTCFDVWINLQTSFSTINTLRQVEIPHYKGIGKRRNREFDALARIIRRKDFSFLRKCVVPAAQRVSAELMEIAAPEIEEDVSGRKSFKNAGKNVGRQRLR